MLPIFSHMLKIGHMILSFSSFFQSVCTLGYCLLPLTIAVLVSRLLLTTPLPSSAVSLVRLVVVVISLVWSVYGELVIPMSMFTKHFVLFCLASLGFLSDYLPSDRKLLAIYPIFLFYFAISCLILAQTNSLL